MVLWKIYMYTAKLVCLPADVLIAYIDNDDHLMHFVVDLNYHVNNVVLYGMRK